MTKPRTKTRSRRPPALPAASPPVPQSAELAADTALHPECTAAMTLERIWAASQPGLLASLLNEPGPVQGPVDAQSLCNRLAAEVRDVVAGSMAGPEAMLVSQAHTLDALFAKLTQLALDSIAKNRVAEFDVLMRAALRAQRQAVAAIGVLSDVKNPPHPAIFAKQANIANGPQQVNNAPAPAP